MDTEERAEYAHCNDVLFSLWILCEAKMAGKKIVEEMIQQQYTHQTMGAGMQQQMQGGGQQKQRGILNPMRYVAGKYV